MPYYLRDVATSLLDGSLHKVRSVNSTSSYCVDEGPATDAPCTISSIRLAFDGAGTAYVLVTASDAYEALLLTASGTHLTTFAGKFGAGMGALRPLASGVEVYVMDPNFNPVTYQTVVNVYDVIGKWLRAIPVAYQATGIAQVYPDGSVVMDDQSALQPTINGVKFYNVRRVAGFTMGQINAPGLGLVKPDGSMWQLPIPVDGWNGFSDQPSLLAVSGDGLTVWPAIPGVDTPEPDRMSFSVPLVASPSVKPPITVELGPAPDTMPPLWIGLVYPRPDLPLVGGNCTWGACHAAPSSMPVTEMSPCGETVKNRPLLCGLWLSDNNAQPETIKPEITYAKARGAHAIYLHEDSPDQAANVTRAAEHMFGTDLTPIFGTNVNQGEYVDSAVQHYGVTLNVRTFGKDPERVADGVRNAFHTIRDIPGCQCLFIFGWFDGAPDEHPSLDDRWPSLATYLRAVMARTPTPDRFPGAPQKPPVPPGGPIVVPRPDDPPKPTKPPTVPVGKLGAIVAAIAAVFSFWKRRKQ